MEEKLLEYLLTPFKNFNNQEQQHEKLRLSVSSRKTKEIYLIGK